MFSHYAWLLKKPKLTKFYLDFLEQEFPEHAENQKVQNEIVLDKEIETEYNGEDIMRQNYDESLRNLLMWQQRTYLFWFFVTTILIPALITKYVCGDSIVHGILYPGILRMFYANSHY